MTNDASRRWQALGLSPGHPEFKPLRVHPKVTFGTPDLPAPSERGYEHPVCHKCRERESTTDALGEFLCDECIQEIWARDNDEQG